jgi:hypothetical protein
MSFPQDAADMIAAANKYALSLIGCKFSYPTNIAKISVF